MVKGDKGRTGKKGAGSSQSRAGTGKGPGNDGANASFQERLEHGKINDAEVLLGEDSYELILKLIARLKEARGEAIPTGEQKKKKKKASGTEEAVVAEDPENDLQFTEAARNSADALEDNGCLEGDAEIGNGYARQEEEKDTKAKKEERVLRRLMRQLKEEDREQAVEDGEPVVLETKHRGKAPPEGATVRVNLCSELKPNDKPKVVAIPRGGKEALEELIKTGKNKFGLAAKKTVWAYVHGGARGDDPKNLHPMPLQDTLQLCHEDRIVFSFKPIPTANATSSIAEGNATHPCHTKTSQEKGKADKADKSKSTGKASNSTASKPAENQEDSLDAVRAAYTHRSRSKAADEPFSKEELKAESEALWSKAEKWRSDPEYSAQRNARAGLPAADVRPQFLKDVASNQVVVVSGETGSGKTTQCPHFILEDYIDRGCGSDCNIICTQPRRIAAIGVAERVSYERGEAPGDVVGYAVRLETRTSRRTRLMFCTTGVLLGRLNDDTSLTGVSHVVVDEAHERNLQTDFLLTILRHLLPRRRDLKLVLMSATLEKGLFVKYFAEMQHITQVPLVNIPGRTHPVQTRFLRDIDAAIQGKAPSRFSDATDDRTADQPPQQTSVDAELEEWIIQTHGVDPKNRDERKVIISPHVQEKLDYRKIADLVAVILKGGQGPDGAEGNDDGAILVFLPGHVEIERALQQLRSHPGVGEQRAWLLPLHGQMPTHRQRQVFKKPPNGASQRKVVLSTNIAETSITIDDVTHVIDCMQVKESRYDPRSRMGILATVYVSQAAAKQRSGRAGRVQPGVCWRFCPKTFFDSQLPEYTLCEMRRTALEELVLQLKLLKLGDDPSTFLSRAPEPPTKESLDAAIRTLTQIGALGAASEGQPLTPLGFHLAHLPMDVRTGKMLLYGALMRCLDPMLTIAACLSHKSPFTRGFGGKGKEAHLRQVRDDAFGHLRSDHLAVAAAYTGWRAARLQGRAAEREYCDKFGLSSSALESIASLREQFTRYLQDAGFVSSSSQTTVQRRLAEEASSKSSEADAYAHEVALQRCVLCAGLYPNAAQIQQVLSRRDGSKKAQLVSVGDLDRCTLFPGSLNTAHLSEMKPNDAWLMYHAKVKTSQVFLHDATLVGSIPLLLFGGGDLKVGADRHTMVVDNVLRFDGKREETAVLLKLLRRETERLLLLKISDPAADITATARPLLEAVTQLLRLEGARADGLKK